MADLRIKNTLHGKNACVCLHCQARINHLQTMNDGYQITINILKDRIMNFYERCPKEGLAYNILEILVDVVKKNNSWRKEI